MPDSSPLALGVALDGSQVRVLGSLIEKEIATPEQYPLSLNALVNACNQRSSREPVLDLSEAEVRDALDTLEDLGLLYIARDARVPKYEHRARTVFNLRRDETAILCLLLLRGPQTPGELRSRADRLYAFDDLAAVQSTLERLASRTVTAGMDPTPARTTPLTVQLARQPGAREVRYAHLLGGTPAGLSVAAAQQTSAPNRMETLEAEVASLHVQIGQLTRRIERLEGSDAPEPPLE